MEFKLLSMQRLLTIFFTFFPHYAHRVYFVSFMFRRKERANQTFASKKNFSWNDDTVASSCSHQFGRHSVPLRSSVTSISLFHLGVGTRLSTFANRVSRAASLWVREKNRPNVIPACRRRRLKGNQCTNKNQE